MFRYLTNYYNLQLNYHFYAIITKVIKISNVRLGRKTPIFGQSVPVFVC